MPVYLRQSTASQEVPLGHFVDSTDGNTAETGLTIANTDIKLWKRGATTLANKNSGGATHISGGVYYAVLDATDTDTIGDLIIFVQVAGALAIRLECIVLDEAVFDWLFGTAAPNTTAPLDAAGTRSAVGLASANLDTQLAAIAAYIDAEVASILAAVDTEVAAIKAVTDQMAFGTANRLNVQVYGVETDAIGAADISAAAANKIADHILRRALATALASSDGDTKTFRSLAGAVAKLVDRIVSSGGTLTIYEPDDTTALGTQTLTTDAAAAPIIEANTV